MNSTKPSLNTKQIWIYEKSKSSYTFTNPGKWMLFYHVSKIDDKWDYFKKIFRDGKLNGIIEMKVSTMAEDPRALSPNTKVIILYCDHSEDEKSIWDIGNTLLPHITDYSSSHIYYKTDKQTRKGTTATGSKNNSTYKLKVFN